MSYTLLKMCFAYEVNAVMECGKHGGSQRWQLTIIHLSFGERKLYTKEVEPCRNAGLLLYEGKIADKYIKSINKKSWLYLILSGITTSLSWIYYFNALKEGEASIVFPIEKLSVVVSIGLSYILLKERMTKKSIIGLILIVAGTYILII